MKLQSEYWHVKRCKINITKYHKHEVNWNNLRTLASTICDMALVMSGDGLNVALQYTFVVKDIPGHATGKGSSSITPWWRHETVEIVLLDLLGSLKHSFSSSDPHPETLFWHSLWHTICKHIWHIMAYLFWHSLRRLAEVRQCRDPELTGSRSEATGGEDLAGGEQKIVTLLNPNVELQAIPEG